MTRSNVVRYVALIAVLLGVGGALLGYQINRARHKFSPMWGGRFQDPEGLAVDEIGNIYVADEDGQAIFMLGPEGNTLFRVDRLEGFPGRLTTGNSLIAMHPGHVIAISGEHNVVEFEIGPDGARLIRTIGKRGDQPGEFQGLEGMARNGEGNLFVTDEDHRQIHVFDANGTYQRSWNVDEEPEGICAFDGRIYVTYAKAGWIECFTREGEPLFRFGRHGRGHGEFRVPDAVRVSPDGSELYVTDQKNNRIQVFSLDGRYRRAFGSKGAAPGSFQDPEDLAFDPQGNLLVADGGNHRIQVFDPEGNLLRIIE